MKWEMASDTASQQIYELWHKEKKLLTVDFHPFTNSARIEYEAEKRVFMVRKEGFLRNKTVLRNEYGVRIGQLGTEKSNSVEGSIILNDEKFYYTIQNNEVPEVIIYRDTPDKPFVVCGLRSDNGSTSIKYGKEGPLNPTEHFLLMALCWYMFLPVAKEASLEYAV